jgi:hypothetical protein
MSSHDSENLMVTYILNFSLYFRTQLSNRDFGRSGPPEIRASQPSTFSKYQLYTLISLQNDRDNHMEQLAHLFQYHNTTYSKGCRDQLQANLEMHPSHAPLAPGKVSEKGRQHN